MTTFPNYDFALTLPAALIVIDMQPTCVYSDVGLGLSMEATQPGYTDYLVQRVENTVVQALRNLASTFHDAGQPVFYTAFASKTGDGTDIRTFTIRQRHEQRRGNTGSSIVAAGGEAASDIIDELPLSEQDCVLIKTSMDAFLTTDIQSRLEAAKVESVVITGVYSDACIESTARSAAELGFRVFVAEDACAGWEPEFHEESMRSLARYFGRVESSQNIIEYIRDAKTRS